MALSYEELISKAADQSLTVRDVIDYGLSRPGVSANAKKKISALQSGFKTMGLDVNMPYVDLRNSTILELFNPEFAPDESNRFGNLSSLELPLQQAIEAAEFPPEKRALYPVLAGAGNRADKLGLGGTQRTGLVGERPMRGLITNAELEEIYDDKLKTIPDGDTRAALLYHRYTGTRIEHLVGENGIKLSDISVTTSEDGVKKVTVAMYGNPKKNRPQVVLTGPLADLIAQQADSRKTAGAKPGEKLFNVSKEKFTSTFNSTIRPVLEERYADRLPIDNKTKKVVSSPTAIRHILPRMLKDEFRVPVDMRKAFMGHTETEIVDRNYAGKTGNVAVGSLVENLLGDAAAKTNNTTIDAKIASYGFELPALNNTRQATPITPFTFSEDTMERGVEAPRVQVSTETEEEIKANAKAAVERAGRVAQEESLKKLQAEIEEMETKTSPEYLALQEKFLRGQAEEKRLKDEIKKKISDEDKPAPKVFDEETTKKAQDMSDFFKGFGKFALAGLGITGVVTASRDAYAKEMQESGSTLRAIGAGAATGAYEALEPTPLAFMRPQEAGKGSDIVPSDAAGKPSYPFVERKEKELLQQMKAGLAQRGAPARPLDKQMSELQGIRPDIEITYPNEEK